MVRLICGSGLGKLPLKYNNRPTAQVYFAVEFVSHFRCNTNFKKPVVWLMPGILSKLMVNLKESLFAPVVQFPVLLVVVVLQ